MFPRPFKKNIFFKTLGFGAVWRSFPLIFSAALKESSGFRVQDVTKILMKIPEFDFDSWQQLGTGSAAENQAGDDLTSELQSALDSGEPGEFSIKL